MQREKKMVETHYNEAISEKGKIFLDKIAMIRSFLSAQNVSQQNRKEFFGFEKDLVNNPCSETS
jgi:predicted metallo-beta-lactamase superfamily hydrolase